VLLVIRAGFKLKNPSGFSHLCGSSAVSWLFFPGFDPFVGWRTTLFSFKILNNSWVAS